jgi:hypothetical protein
MMVIRLLYLLGLLALMLVISAATNMLYNKDIIFDRPAFYLILLASLSLLLILLTWPVISRNKVSAFISKILKIILIFLVFLLIFIELAIVDFAGMAFGHEVMYHISLDAAILGLKEYKFIIILVVVLIGLLTWFMMSAAQLLKRGISWIVFASSLVGFILLGHLTVVGRLYEAAKDYYVQTEIQTMSAKEIEKFAYLGIQPITTKKSDIEIQSKNHKNLIVIYLESFSRVFTQSNKYPNLTPNLNRFSKQYKSLYPYISSANFTMDGLITSMCGFIPDMRMGNNTMASQQGTYSALPCFPDVLQKAGYRQEFFGGAKKEFAGKADFLLAHGFDQVVGWEDFVDLPEYQNEETHNWWGLHDDDLFNRVYNRVSELHKQKEPFHTQILTIGTHLKGFVAPSCEPYSESSHQYIDAIHCTDQLVGQFVKHLDKAGILEDTVVYISGDHGVFNSNLSQELLGKQVEDRNLYGVIIDKNPLDSVYIESLYDLAPAVLKSVGVEHNVQFVLGRSNYTDKRFVFTRYSIYNQGKLIEINYNCDEQTSLRQKTVTACSLKSGMSAVKAHTKLFSIVDGLNLTGDSKLTIGYDNSLGSIESIKLDGVNIKNRFKRYGFAAQEQHFKQPGLFYIGFNENNRTAEKFVLIRADKNSALELSRLRDESQKSFVLFGVDNDENKFILDNLKQEIRLDCVFSVVCFPELTDITFEHILNNPTVTIGIQSLINHRIENE